MRNCDYEAVIATVAERTAMLRTSRRIAVLGAVCIGAAACMPAHDPQSNTNRATHGIQYASETPASRGLAYARESCASCHAVEPGQCRSPNPSAPAFESVANTPGMTRIGLNAWLHTVHPSMPNFIIDKSRIGDLGAYILTLKSDAS